MFGNPSYTNAKALTFSTAPLFYKDSAEAKTYITMMNESEQANSSYGRETPLDPSITFTGNVVRFTRSKNHNQSSTLQLTEYVANMARTRVEKTKKHIFDGAKFGYKKGESMPHSRWEGTRSALSSAFQPVTPGKQEYFADPIMYRIDGKEYNFELGVKVCKQADCGFKLHSFDSTKSTLKNSSERFSPAGIIVAGTFAVVGAFVLA
eukprot:GHVS01085648.1.p1 GENE.GHVS01085648.1~~GHVS01085648.1.p1  ORF type:complete len:207 (-),score=9.39 GHVS01085648.1:24-644(-)